MEVSYGFLLQTCNGFWDGLGRSSTCITLGLFIKNSFRLLQTCGNGLGYNDVRNILSFLWKASFVGSYFHYMGMGQNPGTPGEPQNSW